MNKPFATSRAAWPLVLLCLAVCFVGIFGRDLWTPDEPRVAAISLEMSRTGNIIVPHLAGDPFVEKPPLYFAVAAGFIRFLGPITDITGAIRLTSALWGLGVLGMTFLLAKRIVGRESAIFATLILATTAGFIENMHWIRVDAALFFFVIASVWSLSEVYHASRPWLLLPAGLFTAGAFLSKGIIGPALIGIAWIGMIIPWLTLQWREKKGVELFIPQHILCLLVFVSLAGAWVLMFRKIGGEELWHEWFWENHVGRLLGTGSLSHKRPRNYFYYVRTAAMYSLPWTPLLAVWFVRGCRDFWMKRATSQSRTFLLIWSIGSIVFLSLSITKRDIYLLPVLPAFAIICSEALSEQLPRWCRMYFSFWIALCAVFLIATAISPLIVRLIPVSGPDKAIGFLRTVTPRNLIAAIGAVLCLYMVFARDGISVQTRTVTATAALSLVFLLLLGKAIDREKSMKDDIVSFIQNVPVERRANIVGWDFSETMLGCFYYYGDWSVPQIADTVRLRDIIAGNDSEFDSVIFAEERSISGVVEMPFTTLTQADPGAYGSKRPLAWVEGIRSMEGEETEAGSAK